MGASLNKMQREMLQKLAKGETVSSVIQYYQNNPDQVPDEVQQKKEWTKEQLDFGLECLNEAIDSVISLLIKFDYKLEAARLQAMSTEQRLYILNNIDSIILNIKTGIQNMR